MCRQLKAEVRPGKNAIAARVAWGIHEVQFADPIEAAEIVEAQGSFDEQFDNLWDPTRSGLPADITQDLEADPSTNADGAGSKPWIDQAWQVSHLHVAMIASRFWMLR